MPALWSAPLRTVLPACIYIVDDNGFQITQCGRTTQALTMKCGNCYYVFIMGIFCRRHNAQRLRTTFSCTRCKCPMEVV